MIYLDNAATTFPKPEKVYQTMDSMSRNCGVNSGRGSYRLARDASNIIKETKKQIRELVNVGSSTPVVFSPSITVALNQIIYGIEWKRNVTIYVSPYEHNAVARTIHAIAERYEIRIKLIPINIESLEIDIEKMKYEFSKDKPYAVFCSHISNVTGYILPVKTIFDEAKKYDCITVLDSAQSLGLIEVDSRDIKADFIAFAGHKSLYGPLGIGGFVNASNYKLNGFILGGTGSDSLNLNMPSDNEAKYEAASQNIVAIAGLHAALNSLDVHESYAIEKELTKYLIEKLKKNKRVRMYLPQNEELHIGIVSFSFEGLSSDEVGTILDYDYDIAVRTGYHCAPYIHDYLNDKKSLGTVRVGLGRFNTKEEINFFCDALEEI